MSFDFDTTDAIEKHLAQSVLTTHDTPEAALAVALHDRYAGALCRSDLDLHDWAGCDSHDQWDADAAVILAALDGWTLVPSGLTADWTGDLARAEIARLLKTEEAARLVSQWHGAVGSGPIEELEAELHGLYVLTHAPSEP